MSGKGFGGRKPSIEGNSPRRNKLEINKAPKFEEEFSQEERELMKMFMPDFDQTVENAVEEIWRRFDKDNSGFLDRVESEKMFTQILVEFGEAVDFTDADFRSAFREFERNRNGRIGRDEMKLFIIKMADL